MTFFEITDVFFRCSDMHPHLAFMHNVVSTRQSLELKYITHNIIQIRFMFYVTISQCIYELFFASISLRSTDQLLWLGMLDLSAYERLALTLAPQSIVFSPKIKFFYNSIWFVL